MDFSFDSFAACLQQAFSLATEDSQIELTLVGVEPHSTQRDSDKPTAYSLVFQGPSEPVLPQRMYRLSHAQQGEFDLFIVPIAQDDAGVRYEAVFS